MRFLIDECLSVQLVAVAGAAGHEAHHVAHVGKAGWKDWNVVHYAREQDLVLVTNNAADFRKLYAAQPLHAGLVILIPNVDGELQQQPFKGVPLMSSLPMANPLTRCSRSISTATRRHLHSMSYHRLNDGVGCPRVPSVRHEPKSLLVRCRPILQKVIGHSVPQYQVRMTKIHKTIAGAFTPVVGISDALAHEVKDMKALPPC